MFSGAKLVQDGGVVWSTLKADEELDDAEHRGGTGKTRKVVLILEARSTSVARLEWTASKASGSELRAGEIINPLLSQSMM
jgi:hypothetical protein